jgi:uncharacterized protein (DUF433 family)
MSDEELIARYIELDPYRPGLDRARLKEYAVPVWALIGYLRTPGADIERVAADYDVPIDAVKAALAYYHRYQAPKRERLGEQATSTRNQTELRSSTCHLTRALLSP